MKARQSLAELATLMMHCIIDLVRWTPVRARAPIDSVHMKSRGSIEDVYLYDKSYDALGGFVTAIKSRDLQSLLPYRLAQRVPSDLTPH